MSADSDGVDGVIGRVKLVSGNQIQLYTDVGASSLRSSGGFATRIITEYSLSQEIQAIESITSDGFTAQNIGLFPVGGTVILVGSNVHLGTLAHNRYEWIVAGKEVKNGENKVLLKDFNSTLYDDGWHGIAVRAVL